MDKTLIIVFLVVFCRCFVASTTSDIEKHVRTLHGNEDPHEKYKIFEVPDGFAAESVGRFRRDAHTPKSNFTLDTKVSHLNDSHKQLMVHWVGEVVICLAKDPPPARPSTPVSPSSVFISYDNGITYEDKTEALKLENGTRSTLEKFYNHDGYKSHFVFTDIKNNVIFVTRDHGRNFARHILNFSPVDLAFHEYDPSIFAVLSSNHLLYITEDFGQSFRLAHAYVKSFHWLKSVDENLTLVVQRFETNGISAIIYSNDLFKSRIIMYGLNIVDMLFKDDYLFTSRKNEEGHLELHVSYKLNMPHRCKFSTDLPIRNFIIVDVADNRAMVAVNHSPNKTNLYVSNSLEPKDDYVGFILSLEDVFSHFPNNSVSDIWLKKSAADEAFADVYKVKGLSGIYIASRIISLLTNNTLSPHHIGSVITFDGGARWRPIQPPAVDAEGQTTGCLPPNCSLQLSQKFQQLYPKTQPVSILSSASAPGVILAAGVLGGSLKGHFAVYVSLDGGVSWRQILREQHFFNMGDHGGILAAAKMFMMKGDTRHILYSLDEGRNWLQTQFHNENVKLYGLMTEPGENTLIFTMFGSLPAEHSWLIVRVNFTDAFPNGPCNKTDYKMWSPSSSYENRSYIPCILGEETTYQRRKSNALCLNGADYVHVVSKKPCACDYLDFECDVGFKRVGGAIHNSHFRCVVDGSLNVDLFSTPARCKPGLFFDRSRGYRKIAGDICEGGFESHYLPDTVPCPFTEVDDFLLFAQRENISRFNLVTLAVEELPVKNLRNVIAIDFDILNNCVYWADITLDTINRQCFANGSKSEVLVSNELSSIEGMAFDWISKTLYFVDGVRAKIELIRTDVNHGGRMRRTILNGTVLTKPRGIAVHPQAGYMFWTDWSHEDPSVSRSNLDGTNVKKLFGKERVMWPNGIAVDYIANRIYWVDAQKDYIGSSDLHGDGFVEVLSDAAVVSHPFAIAIFKDTMYWDDWKRNGIFAMSKETKFHFQIVQGLVEQLQNLMDLKAYGTGQQYGKNSCSTANCSAICVGMPRDSHSCLCPDGLTALPDGRCQCPNGVDAYPNMTCSSAQRSCSVGQFTCQTGLCVSKEWRCDGEDDCGDGSDELECDRKTCPSRNHMCGDGKCLPEYWRCDYDIDCDDGSDELNCPKQNCTSDQFLCDNGKCVSKSWRCDGENDCRDNSDERNCSPDRPENCKPEEFRCKSGAIACISASWQCDGQMDCSDGSDEDSCEDHECGEGQFTCQGHYRKCIDQTFFCDGEQDCLNGEDEHDCSTAATPSYPVNPTADLFESNGTCLEFMFRCKNKRCIPMWWKCDSANDCGDNSDELGCGPTPEVETTTTRPPGQSTACGPNMFECRDGSCRRSAWVCDGVPDCSDGEDELNCGGRVGCTPDEFKCLVDGSCIPRSKTCDGTFDCPDDTDEIVCAHDLPPNASDPSCGAGFFPCAGRCRPLAERCDGRRDCPDAADERDCASAPRYYQVTELDEDRKFANATSLTLRWRHRNLTELEFMPAIAEAGRWRNASWEANRTEHTFGGLKPYTEYVMAVYAREKGSERVAPPIKHVTARTLEGIPSEPWNVTAKQINESHIVVTWQPPQEPNGVIVNYQVTYSLGNSTVLRLNLDGNKTSLTLSGYYLHNMKYTFYVAANNKLYKSKPSKPATLVFDGEAKLTRISSWKSSTNQENSSFALSWEYSGQADGFTIRFTAENYLEGSYPNIQPIFTKSKSINGVLAPGATYHVELFAMKKTLEGPKTFLKITMPGTKLPKVEQVQVPSEAGTIATINWMKPEDKRNVSWVYGVYYSTNEGQLLEKPIYKTSNLTARIYNLRPCESYLFTVGIIGPLGLGPLSKIKQLHTSVLAPPRKLQLSGVDEKTAAPKMELTWEACPMTTQTPTSYLIFVNELKSNRSWTFGVDGTQSSVTYNVSRGGVYSVKMKVKHPEAKYSKPVVYTSPQIPPPIEISVVPETNGSFVVFWLDKEKETDGPLKYEVLVQEGRSLDETNAMRFTVDKPPFVYTNFTSHTYTFAVRAKSEQGLSAMTSPWISKYNEAIRPEEPRSMAVIWVPTLLVVVGLFGVIVFLVLRHRRLQNSFTRFANSHYDTRSGAATFDDSVLDEEENPRIVGFSDDEPLVIA